MRERTVNSATVLGVAFAVLSLVGFSGAMVQSLGRCARCDAQGVFVAIRVSSSVDDKIQGNRWYHEEYLILDVSTERYGVGAT